MGRGVSQAEDDALAWESSVLAEYADWLQALEKTGMQQERRRAVLRTNDLRWRWLDNAFSFIFIIFR